MPFDMAVAIRALHILTATLWVGGAFFMAFILGPSLRKAGPAAGPFMATVLRRGGLAPYFLAVGVVAILSGGYVYSEAGHASEPFGTAGSTMVTLGAIFAVAGIGVGFGVLLPNESRMRRLLRAMPAGPPPAETAAQMQAMGAKQGKASAVGAGLMAIALVFMVLRPVVA